MGCSIGRLCRPSVIVAHHPLSSNISSETAGPIKAKFHVEPQWDRGKTVVQIIWVMWPRWPPYPYMGKTLQKSSPKSAGRWHSYFIYSITDLGPTKFVQMMILGWSWCVYYTARSTLLPNAFVWENALKILDFIETIEVYDLKVSIHSWLFKWDYLSTRGQDPCLTFVQGYSDLYFQTFSAAKLLGLLKPNYMYSFYGV